MPRITAYNGRLYGDNPSTAHDLRTLEGQINPLRA